MTDLRQAAQQALDALMQCHDWLGAYDKCSRAVHELRAALAEPQPEPVAWVSKHALDRIKDFDGTIYANSGFDNAVPLYTHPPQRQPQPEPFDLNEARSEELFRTAFEPQPKPVFEVGFGWLDDATKYPKGTKFYTTPPQRQPLTIDEVEQILAQHDYAMHGDRARYIVRMTEKAHNIGGDK